MIIKCYKQRLAELVHAVISVCLKSSSKQTNKRNLVPKRWCLEQKRNNSRHADLYKKGIENDKVIFISWALLLKTTFP